MAGYDATNQQQYPVPVGLQGQAAGAPRVVLVGGSRNRSDVRVLPLIGSINSEQVCVEHRVKSLYRNTALSNVKQSISVLPGYIYGWHIINPNATPVYIKFCQGDFATVVVGTTPPIFTLFVPGNSVADLPPNVRALFRLANAMTIACVTGLADNNTTAPATAVMAQIYNSGDDYA